MYRIRFLVLFSLYRFIWIYLNSKSDIVNYHISYLEAFYWYIFGLGLLPLWFSMEIENYENKKK